MRLLIISILIFTAMFPVFAEGDSLYIHAVTGLKMRENPSEKSKVINSFPYGAKVEKIETSQIISNISGFTDYWIKVKSKNKIGYMYGGFLSRLPTPKNNESESSIKEYLKINKIKFKLQESSTDEAVITTLIKLNKYSIEEIFLIYKKLLVDFSEKINSNSSKENFSFKIKPELPPNLLAYKIEREKSGKWKSFEIKIEWGASGSTLDIEVKKKGKKEILIKEVFALP
ncbi:MAG: SH3 domain-containing protein [Leptospiraceae bacterium]|nr:SH3 domain-containing protein [Leptospiraceae bacterium]